MKRKYIIIAILTIIAAYYARVIVAAKQLKFGAGSIRTLRFSGGIISWTQIIKVTNGEGIAIPVTSANLENRINNTAIGQSFLPRPQIIAARAVSNLEVSIAIPWTDLIALGIEVINTIKTGIFSFQLAGNVRALGVSVPVSEEIKIDFKQLF